MGILGIGLRLGAARAQVNSLRGPARAQVNSLHGPHALHGGLTSASWGVMGSLTMIPGVCLWRGFDLEAPPHGRFCL